MLSTVKFSSQLTDSLKISVFTSHDLTFFHKKELALIGISLHNPYFTEDRLITILAGFSYYFKQVVVLLADSIVIHNYQAMGYSDSKAQSQVRKHGNRMVNRINRAMDHVGQENICLVRWSEIEAFSGYHEKLHQVKLLYRDNSEFSADVRSTTLRFVSKYVTETSQQFAALEEAKWYLLKEIAFVYSASDFFSSSLLNCYYQDFTVCRKVLHGHYTAVPVKNQGTLCYEVQ